MFWDALDPCARALCTGSGQSTAIATLLYHTYHGDTCTTRTPSLCHERRPVPPSFVPFTLGGKKQTLHVVPFQRSLEPVKASKALQMFTGPIGQTHWARISSPPGHLLAALPAL
jgi:hypothetical protein